MSISSINYGASVLGQSVQNLNNQLTTLSTQLSSGVKSTNYAGMGVNEGFAIAARAQLANITAFGTTMTNVNTVISAANTALQTLSSIGSQVQSGASSGSLDLNCTGQTVAQQTAASELSAVVGVLNTQVGDRYIFSGSAINTPAVASADSIINGTGTQAGLKQVIAERQQADLGTNGLGRLVISSPTQADLGLLDPDGSHGRRSLGLAAGNFGRPRRHQSQPGRPGQLHLQSPRWHHPDRSTDSNEHDAAADRQLYHWGDADGDGGEPEQRPDSIDHHACQHLAGGGVGG